MHIRRQVATALVALLAIIAMPFPTQGYDGRSTPSNESPRLPADFEPQKTLLLGWDKVEPPVQQVVISVAKAAALKISVVILVPTETERIVAEAKAREAAIPAESLRIAVVPINTCWVRDFAPIAVEQPRGAFHLIDADYIADKRREDDALAAAVGPLFGLSVQKMPLILEGGNLLSNGRGLIITTSKLPDDNTARDFDRPRVERMLRDAFGARQIVALEPLLGEMTGHVDMFVTFTAADTVVIASSTPKVDRINTEILTRNTELLESVKVDGKPLRVERLPMPPRVFEVWRSYTNVIFANGILLVPKYGNVDNDGQAAAVALYRKLLPGWAIVSIESEPLARIGGSLRCASAVIAGVKSLPKPIRPVSE